KRAVGRPPDAAYGCGYPQRRRRIGRRGARRYSHNRRHDLAVIVADNPHYTDSFHVGGRSSRSWFCPAPFSSRGNATGFMQFEYSLSGKWLELIKQSAPSTTHAAVIRDPSTTSGIGQFAVIQSVASSLGVEVVPIDGRDADQISQAIEVV